MEGGYRGGWCIEGADGSIDRGAYIHARRSPPRGQKLSPAAGPTGSDAAAMSEPRQSMVSTSEAQQQQCQQPHGKRRTGTACMVTPSLHEPGAHARDASSPQVAARRHRRQLVHVTRRATTSSCGAGLLAGCRTLQAPRVAPRAASGGSSCGRTLCPFEVGVGLVHGHGARECTSAVADGSVSRAGS